MHDSAEVYNRHDGNKNNLRTIETQIEQQLKNNEARPKVTGSYKENSVYCILPFGLAMIHAVIHNFKIVIGLSGVQFDL